jgi:hypothetical protein
MPEQVSACPLQPKAVAARRSRRRKARAENCNVPEALADSKYRIEQDVFPENRFRNMQSLNFILNPLKQF